MTGPIDQGDTYGYRFTVTDSSGTLANAGTVTVTITLPDGTTTAPAVVNSSTGLYDIAYTTTQVGLHNLKASATGGILGTEFRNRETTFTVEEPKRQIISEEEALDHLNGVGLISGNANLERLRWLCLVASDVIERDLQRVIARRTVVDTFDGGYNWIQLRSTPIISITSVVEAGTTLVLNTGYTVDFSQGVIWRGTSYASQNFTSGWQNIVVTYVAGYASPPRVVRKVALNVVQELWQSSQQASHPLLDEVASRGLDMLPMALESLTSAEQRAYRSLKSLAGFA